MKTKLTDTQLIVLNKAAQRSTMLALPLPPNLKGGAANKVVIPLIQKGLLEEIDADPRIQEPVWRRTGDGHGVTLAITELGLAALGIGAEKPAKEIDESPVAEPTVSLAPANGPEICFGTMPEALARAATPPREGTKQAAMVSLLQRETGATIAEIIEATGWQQHTVRGAFAGTLKKKLGLNVVSEKVDGRGRVYRIAA